MLPFFSLPLCLFYQPIMKAPLKEPSRRKVLFKFRYPKFFSIYGFKTFMDCSILFN